MKRMFCFLLSPILTSVVYAQRYTGYGRGYDGEDGLSIVDTIKNFPILLVIAPLLFIVWIAIRSIVNRKPKKERAWSYSKFAYKYEDKTFFYSNGCFIQGVELSGSLFREKVYLNCSGLYYTSGNDMLNDRELKVVRLTNGEYVLRRYTDKNKGEN